VLSIRILEKVEKPSTNTRLPMLWKTEMDCGRVRESGNKYSCLCDWTLV